jgi:FkbM family methyltransferase
MRNPAKVLQASVQANIRQYLWRTLNLRHKLASGILLEINSPADWEVYNEIFVEGEYDRAIIGAIEQSSAQGINILDVGANMGFFSLRILDLAHRTDRAGLPLNVWMVEGSPRVLAELKNRQAFQTLLSRGAHLIEGLAGKKHGSAVLQESDHHSYNTIMESGGGAGYKSVPVQFVDLEPLFDRVPSIDLLKCDIQGAEEFFLESNPGILAKCRATVIELHHWLCDTERCVRLLRKAGFMRINDLRRNSRIAVVLCER